MKAIQLFTCAVCLLIFTPSLPAQAVIHETLIGQGVTTPSDWKDYELDGQGFDYDGVYVDVNTASCGFKTTPHYLVTLESVDEVPRAGSGKWEVSGYNAIYQATPEGFRVYARWTDGQLNRSGYSPQLTAEQAEKFRYVIRWTAISTLDCNPCGDTETDPNGPGLPQDTSTTNVVEVEVPRDVVGLYPNPAGSELNIKTLQRVLGVRLYTTTGTLLKEYGEGTTQLDISELRQGNYVVEVSLPGKVTVSRQFVKQ